MSTYAVTVEWPGRPLNRVDCAIEAASAAAAIATAKRRYLAKYPNAEFSAVQISDAWDARNDAQAMRFQIEDNNRRFG